jgi:hypothetical protein
LDEQAANNPQRKLATQITLTGFVGAVLVLILLVRNFVYKVPPEAAVGFTLFSSSPTIL